MFEKCYLSLFDEEFSKSSRGPVMFDVRCSSVRGINMLFEFNHEQMNTLQIVRCWKNDVRVRLMFDKMMFDSSLKAIQHTMQLDTIPFNWDH